jgi:hypothetical protein
MELRLFDPSGLSSLLDFLVICTTANVNELAMTISTVWWYMFLGLNPCIAQRIFEWY